MTVRAKLRCDSVKTYDHSKRTATVYRDGETVEVNSQPRTYEFQAMYDPSIPEDQRYALATPSAQLTMYVDNPAVTFEPGKSYYIDFTPAE